MSCDHTKGCTCCNCTAGGGVHLGQGTRVGAGPSHGYVDDDIPIDVIFNKIRDRKFETAKRFNARALKFGNLHCPIKCRFSDVINRIRKRKCTRAKRFNACTGVLVIKVCSHKPPCRLQGVVGLKMKYDDANCYQRRDVPSTSMRDTGQQTTKEIKETKETKEKSDGPVMEKAKEQGHEKRYDFNRETFNKFKASLPQTLPPFAEKIRERKFTKTKRFHGGRRAIEPIRKPGTEDTPYVDNNVYIDWQGIFEKIKSRKYSRARRFEVKAGFSVIDLRPKGGAADTATAGVTGALRH